MNEKLSEIQHKIVGDICESIGFWGGKSDLVGIIASWRDAISEAEVLSSLKAWNDSAENVERVEIHRINYPIFLSNDD